MNPNVIVHDLMEHHQNRGKDRIEHNAGSKGDEQSLAKRRVIA